MKTPGAQPSVTAGGPLLEAVNTSWPQSILATKSAQSGHSLKDRRRRRYVLESDIAHRGRD
jgi:hypothetical protein